MRLWILDYCSGVPTMVRLSAEREKELESMDAEEFVSKYEKELCISSSDCHFMVTSDCVYIDEMDF